MCHGPERDMPPDGPFQKNCNVLSIFRSGKGDRPLLLGMRRQGASHKRGLSPLSFPAKKRGLSPFPFPYTPS